MMVSCADSPEPNSIVSTKKKEENIDEDAAKDAAEKEREVHENEEDMTP